MKITDVKKKILNLIRLTSNSEYSNFIQSYGYGLLNTIKEKVYESKTLESSILNFSPIVCYGQTIVKPEMIMEDSFFNDNSSQKIPLDLAIRNILTNFTADILMNNELYIAKSNLLARIISLNSYDKKDYITISYFVLVYLRYIEKIECDHYQQTLDKIIEIYTNSNKILNGEKINVRDYIRAMESLIID